MQIVEDFFLPLAVDVGDGSALPMVTQSMPSVLMMGGEKITVLDAVALRSMFLRATTTLFAPP